MGKTAEVATIRPYVEPFCEERVWDLVGFEDWERELLTAVKVGAVHALEDAVAKLENPNDKDWAGLEQWKPHGKSRAFALDYQGDLIYHGVEPREGHRVEVRETGAFRDWRRQRAATFTRFGPAVTQRMLHRLESEEEETLESLRWAYLNDDSALSAPFRARGEAAHAWPLLGD